MQITPRMDDIKNIYFFKPNSPSAKVTPHPTRSNVKRTILIDFSTRMLSITGPYLTFSTAISITIPANEHILLCPIPEYNNQSHAVTPPVMPDSDPRQLVASEINCDSRFTGEISNKKISKDLCLGLSLPFPGQKLPVTLTNWIFDSGNKA